MIARGGVDLHNDGFSAQRLEGPKDQDWTDRRMMNGDLSIRSVTFQLCRNDYPFGDPCGSEITVRVA